MTRKRGSTPALCAAPHPLSRRPVLLKMAAAWASSAPRSPGPECCPATFRRGPWTPCRSPRPESCVSFILSHLRPQPPLRAGRASSFFPSAPGWLGTVPGFLL